MRGRRVLGGLLALAVLMYLARFAWLPPIAAWLNVSDPQLPVDFVVPLPGGNDDRPFAAAALIRSGLAAEVGVLVNELTPHVADGLVRPMHEVTREVLMRRGVSAEAILMLEGTSNSTFSDIQIIGQLFAKQPNATIAIVTAPSHTRRVRWSVDRILPGYRDQVCVIATFNDSFDEQIWWRSDQGLQVILSEYLKLIFYWLAYSSSIQRAVVVGTILVTMVLAWLAFHRQSRPSTSAAQAADLA